MIRTPLVFITLLLSTLIVIWTHSKPAFFIGAWAFLEFIVRCGMRQCGWARFCWEYEVLLTVAALSILIALVILARDIWTHKKQ